MKNQFLLPILFICMLGVLVGQEMPYSIKQSENVPPELAIPSKVFIPPSPPKEVPPMKVEASSSRAMPTHQITILRSDASTLPDIPPPPPPKEFVARLPGESVPMLSLGATVYDRNISRVQWFEPRSKIRYEAWCAWDCSLLSPLSSIKVGDRVRKLSLFSSNVDTSKITRFGKANTLPVHPPLQENSFVITKGDSTNPDAILVLTTLRDYYLKHKDRLVLIQKARDEHQAAANAWHKANPPQPHNHTIWLKPHRGSRYLKQEGGDR